MTLGPRDRRALRWLATLGLGALGGLAASRVGAPLPWLIGPMIAVAGVAVGGVRILGEPPAFPMSVRQVFIPVVGVLIGSAMTPQVLEAAAAWWPGLIIVVVFVAAAHWTNYQVFRRLGGLSRPTAYFASMPGGLMESLEMGERAGADLRQLTVLQFARIAVVVTLLPLLLSAIEGRVLGSAAGVAIAGAHMGPDDAIVLALCGWGGVAGAARVGLPAGQVMGPVILSGLAHALGVTDAAPPATLVAAAQLVIGVSLGQRFVGLTARELARWLGLSAVSVAGMAAIGGALGLAAAAIGLAAPTVMLIALSPGGVVEMGLVALSLAADPIFVTAHHMARILATVVIAQRFWRPDETT